MKKGIAYYRVSTVGQEENTSLEEQRQRTAAFCLSQGIEITAEFQDVASGGNCNRPGYQQALDYMAENHVDVFVAFKFDRVHRHQQNLLVFEANLRERGISFITVQEMVDTSSPMGKLMFQILGSFAEFERDTINDRMQRGREASLASGRSAGGNIPFGYGSDWEVDPSEAEVIKEFFRQYLKLRSLGKLVEYARGQGYKTRSGKHFTRQALHVILTNRVYLGEYSYNETTVKAHHAGIVASSVFGKVQKALRR